MAQFRQHNTGQIQTTVDEDEIADYDADPLWQRLDDDQAAAAEKPAPQPRARKS